ncbi:hypothetical protein RFI_13124 [Reticulomyxa filosa]|uniref:Hcy-binding domain-containing protein n=1 Tax=Reticulomyxa filosa TaxID=46433 RepID=X6NCK0_RETFI|nr:hypothetical protein RFI_13124 [Reticulomyxa filosa]|eukprot:ETO24035.1 hypothetical protein RFI_13124 [Reticulomyxa filosa]
MSFGTQVQKHWRLGKELRHTVIKKKNDAKVPSTGNVGSNYLRNLCVDFEAKKLGKAKEVARIEESILRNAHMTNIQHGSDCLRTFTEYVTSPYVMNHCEKGVQSKERAISDVIGFSVEECMSCVNESSGAVIKQLLGASRPIEVIGTVGNLFINENTYTTTSETKNFPLSQMTECYHEIFSTISPMVDYLWIQNIGNLDHCQRIQWFKLFFF